MGTQGRKSVSLGHTGSWWQSQESHSHTWTPHHHATTAPTPFFGVERGEKLLRDFKEKEEGRASSPNPPPRHYGSFLPSSNIANTCSSCRAAPPFAFEHPLLHWTAFPAPGVTRDPGLTNRKTWMSIAQPSHANQTMRVEGGLLFDPEGK